MRQKSDGKLRGDPITSVKFALMHGDGKPISELHLEYY